MASHGSQVKWLLNWTEGRVSRFLPVSQEKCKILEGAGGLPPGTELTYDELEALCSLQASGEAAGGRHGGLPSFLFLSFLSSFLSFFLSCLFAWSCSLFDCSLFGWV